MVDPKRRRTVHVLEGVVCLLEKQHVLKDTSGQYEECIPLRPEVRGACEILGLDPLHIANEGQFIAVVAPEHAEQALEALQQAPGGDGAGIIGEIREQPARSVLSVSSYGGTRLIDMLVGDPLPRIC